MIEFSEMIEKEFEKLPKDISIRSIHFSPVNKDGRAVSCFTPFHIGYPDRSVTGCDHLDILCWYAEKYAVSKKYRRGSRNLQAIGDCKECNFCLNKAAGYYMALSVDAGDREAEDINDIMYGALRKISSNLNKPLSTVLIGNHNTGESWELDILEVK